MIDTIEGRRWRRVPLYTTVDLPEVEVPGVAYATNVSEGGLAIKVIDAAPEALPRGLRLTVSFRLPGGKERLTLQCRLRWVTPAQVGFTGRQALAVGLQFEEGQVPALEEVRRFVHDFQQRVGVVGPAALGSLQEALGELYRLEAWPDEAAMRQGLQAGQAALVLVVAPLAEEGLELLQKVLSAGGESQVGVIYCGPGDHPELERLSRSGRVVLQEASPPKLVLRSVARRAIESQLVAAENERLTAELEEALGQLRRENRALRARVIGTRRLEGIVGDSESLKKVIGQVERVAPLSTTVTLLGESGTGKELVARAIHALSPRAQKPFVAQNCAALPESLLDAELFGHTRGAFTGAVAERPGLFESADGGTVFLDEVGEMTASMQAKLLRVLQEGEVRRLGSNRTLKLDVRILCATHRNLEALVREERFREDLYYRLSAFLLRLPPLRERKDDIGPLAAHFLDCYARQHGRPVPGLSAGALRILESFHWPGNIRELQHAMERLIILCEPGAPIDPSVVHEALGGTAASPSPGPQGAGSLDESMERYERALVLAALEASGGVLAHAARNLGVNRSTLSRRCRRLGIVAAGGEAGSKEDGQQEPPAALAGAPSQDRRLR